MPNLCSSLNCDFTTPSVDVTCTLNTPKILNFYLDVDAIEVALCDMATPKIENISCPFGCYI
jgi:hypothetical protein